MSSKTFKRTLQATVVGSKGMRVNFLLGWRRVTKLYASKKMSR